MEPFDYLQRREHIRQQQIERSKYFERLFHLPGKNLREPEYLIDGLLPQGYLAIMAGDPKVGKTCLATAIAFAVAAGTDFAGLKTKQAAVLWLSLEESPQERAAALGTFKDILARTPPWPNDDETEQSLIESTGWGPDEIANLPIFTCYERIPIDSEQGIAALEYWQRKTDAKLIVVDPLHAAHSGRSLTDGWSARKTLQLIKRFASQHRITVLILHHLSTYGKNNRVAESAQLSACASMFMLLTEISSLSQHAHPAVKTFQLVCQGRGAVNRTWFFQCPNPQTFLLFDPPIISTSAPERRTSEHIVLQSVFDSEQPICANNIIQKTVLGQSTVRNALTRLEAKGLIRLACILSGTRYYSKPESPNANDHNDENQQNDEKIENGKNSENNEKDENAGKVENCKNTQNECVQTRWNRENEENPHPSPEES